jgi:hypothetical protein
MVGTGNPAGVLTVKASLADQNILDGIVEHVTHVEHSGNVWWGYNDCIGFATIRLTAE